MARFVVLDHDWPSPHRDLMLERDGMLRTWRLPADFTPGERLTAVPLPDHRLHYLDYEGPLTGERGSVRLWDRGEVDWISCSPLSCVVILSGCHLRGRYLLMADSHADDAGENVTSENWYFTYESEVGATSGRPERTTTIFFDFGNVVAFFDHARALARLAPYTDIAATELALILYGSPIEDAYERGALTTAEYVRAAKANGRLSCTDDDFLSAFVDIFWRNDEVCELIPQLAREYRLVLASNTNDAHFRQFREQFADVLQVFHHLGTSHQAGVRKPQANFFAYCQQFAAGPPETCLFIDDLATNTPAARRHGWRTIDYRPGQNLRLMLAKEGLLTGT